MRIQISVFVDTWRFLFIWKIEQTLPRRLSICSIFKNYYEGKVYKKLIIKKKKKRSEIVIFLEGGMSQELGPGPTGRIENPAACTNPYILLYNLRRLWYHGSLFKSKRLFCLVFSMLWRIIMSHWQKWKHRDYW